MSYYKSIDGVNYDKGLLEKADALTKGRGDGRISEDDAAKIWEDALDGGKVTRIERRTLEYIILNYNCTDSAIRYLENHLYRTIEETKLDRVLIDAAELAIEGLGDGRVSEDDAKTMWAMVSNDSLMTKTEKDTLLYIVKNYNCTDAARSFIMDKILKL